MEFFNSNLKPHKQVENKAIWLALKYLPVICSSPVTRWVSFSHHNHKAIGARKGHVSNVVRVAYNINTYNLYNFNINSHYCFLTLSLQLQMIHKIPEYGLQTITNQKTSRTEQE